MTAVLTCSIFAVCFGGSGGRGFPCKLVQAMCAFFQLRDILQKAEPNQMINATVLQLSAPQLDGVLLVRCENDLNDRWMKLTLTQSLIVVLCVTGQSEQGRSHFLTALVQVLTPHTPKWMLTNCYGYSWFLIWMHLHWLVAVPASVTAHLNEFSVALVGGSAVIVL